MVTFIFVLVLLTLAGLYISRPLIIPHAGIPKPMTPRERLLAEKIGVMARIRDLDFDVETGKIPQSEHQHLREPLLARAAALLQQIDEMDSRLEKKIASRRVTTTADRHSSTRFDDEIEAAVARRRRGRFCTQCGQAAAAEDRFCAGCGSKLPETTPTT
jgi:RNA polymerase-binding transcription factor DksA